MTGMIENCGKKSRQYQNRDKAQEKDENVVLEKLSKTFKNNSLWVWVQNVAKPMLSRYFNNFFVFLF